MSAYIYEEHISNFHRRRRRRRRTIGTWGLTETTKDVGFFRCKTKRSKHRRPTIGGDDVNGVAAIGTEFGLAV